MGVIVTIRLIDASSATVLVEGVSVFDESDKLRYVNLHYCGTIISGDVYLEAFIGEEQLGNSPKTFTMLSGPYNMTNSYIEEFNDATQGC